MPDQWTYQILLSGLHELHLIRCTKPIEYLGDALVQHLLDKRTPRHRLHVPAKDGMYPSYSVL